MLAYILQRRPRRRHPCRKNACVQLSQHVIVLYHVPYIRLLASIFVYLDALRLDQSHAFISTVLTNTLIDT